MKLLNASLSMILLATMNVGFAAKDDGLIQQMKITNDAVKTALEGLDLNSFGIEYSLDAQKKKAIFNQRAEEAMKTYQLQVRIKILQPFSILVNQYNAIAKDATIDAPDKVRALAALHENLRNLAWDKSKVHSQVLEGLFLPIINIPLATDLTCLGGSGNKYVLDGVVRYVRGAVKIHREQKYGCGDNIYDLIQNRALSPVDPRGLMLEDCYTGSCFQSTLNQNKTYIALVRSLVIKPIVIKLDDGSTVEVLGKVSQSIEHYLFNIPEGKLVDDLPFNSSNERIEILGQLKGQLNTGKCRNTSGLTAQLCDTVEGCLNASEIALFTSQFGQKAACL